MRGYRTPTDIEVTILNTNGLEIKAFEELDKSKWAEDNQPTRCTAGHKPHGFVKTPIGIFALCEEGVGDSSPITKDNPYSIPFFASRAIEDVEGSKGWFSCMPCIEYELDDTDLFDFAIAEKQNLASFIRVFGARLDVNYEDWRQAIEKAMKL